MLAIFNVDEKMKIGNLAKLMGQPALRALQYFFFFGEVSGTLLGLV
jgi:hypothetical protein